MRHQQEPLLGSALKLGQCKMTNSFLVLLDVFVIHGSSLQSVTLSPTLHAWGLRTFELPSTFGNWKNSKLELVTLGGLSGFRV